MRRGGAAPARPRHIAVRTCIACRSERPKRELVRIVRGADGGVRVDPGSKVAGRGAYVCPNRECWEESFRRGTLVQALKIDALPTDDLAHLQEFAANLPAVRSTE